MADIVVVKRLDQTLGALSKGSSESHGRRPHECLAPVNSAARACWLPASSALPLPLCMPL